MSVTRVISWLASFRLRNAWLASWISRPASDPTSAAWVTLLEMSNMLDCIACAPPAADSMLTVAASQEEVRS